MAKAAVKPKPPAGKPNLPARTQSVEKRKNTDVAELDKMMGEDAGQGLSTDASDNLVPLIYILQPLSPQVLKKNENFIEGAEPGMIWLKNNAETPLAEELDFQPCHFSKGWVEWIPRKKGGGFVASYPTKPAEAEQYQDPDRPQSIRWRMPSGNDVIETRYYAGRVHLGEARLNYIIPLSSTGHTVGKDLMFQLNNRLKNGAKAPMFANVVKFKTKMRSNNAGEWYVFEIASMSWVDNVDDYQAGKALNSAFASGAKKAEQPAGDQPGGEQVADDDDM